METNLYQEGLTKENDPHFMTESKTQETVTQRDLIERQIIFNAPGKDVVVKVINMQKEIQIKDVTVTGENVMVSGYLNNCIMYTTMKRPPKENNKENNTEQNDNEKHGYKNMGNDNNSNNNSNNNNSNDKKKEKEKPKPSCGVIDNSIAIDGVVRHTTVWTPFKLYIPVKGVQKNTSCKILNSFVIKDSVANIIPIYEEENEAEGSASTMRSEETTSIIGGEEEQKFIKGIIDRTLIEITVEVML